MALAQVLGMSFEDWFRMYTDLPSKQIKVPVANKDRIKCSADEMVVVSPAELQDTLNAAMRSPTQDRLSRCFVRPSGTENVVRIYAEAPSAAQAAELADAAILALQALNSTD
jgi:phosphoacetylglucosamine mutase